MQRIQDIPECALEPTPLLKPYWGKLTGRNFWGGRWKRRHHSKLGPRHRLTRLSNSWLDQGVSDGYTKGMKTAISIPNDMFEKAERLARRMRKSRSQLYSHALDEYVARHAPDRVTEAMDRVCAKLGQPTDSFVSTASRRILERSDW